MLRLLICLNHTYMIEACSVRKSSVGRVSSEAVSSECRQRVTALAVSLRGHTSAFTSRRRMSSAHFDPLAHMNGVGA